jgi:hypothetical protein
MIVTIIEEERNIDTFDVYVMDDDVLASHPVNDSIWGFIVISFCDNFKYDIGIFVCQYAK